MATTSEEDGICARMLALTEQLQACHQELNKLLITRRRAEDTLGIPNPTFGVTSPNGTSTKLALSPLRKATVDYFNLRTDVTPTVIAAHSSAKLLFVQFAKFLQNRGLEDIDADEEDFFRAIFYILALNRARKAAEAPSGESRYAPDSPPSPPPTHNAQTPPRALSPPPASYVLHAGSTPGAASPADHTPGLVSPAPDPPMTPDRHTDAETLPSNDDSNPGSGPNSGSGAATPTQHSYSASQKNTSPGSKGRNLFEGLGILPECHEEDEDVLSPAVEHREVVFHPEPKPDEIAPADDPALTGALSLPTHPAATGANGGEHVETEFEAELQKRLEELTQHPEEAVPQVLAHPGVLLSPSESSFEPSRTGSIDFSAFLERQQEGLKSNFSGLRVSSLTHDAAAAAAAEKPREKQEREREREEEENRSQAPEETRKTSPPHDPPHDSTQTQNQKQQKSTERPKPTFLLPHLPHDADDQFARPRTPEGVRLKPSTERPMNFGAPMGRLA